MPEDLLHISIKPSEQILELLEENCIGTSGKSMVYKHSGVKSKVLSIKNALFASLSIRDQLYGTICLCRRKVFNSGKEQNAFYLRYFTFRKQFRASNPERKTRQSESKIRAAVIELMAGKGLDFHGNLILYAYVDPSNIRSRYLVEEFGFEKVGSFRVIPFSRIFCKKNNFVKVADTLQHECIKSALSSAYKNAQLVAYENLFKKGEYFVLMDKGQMVCGLQAIPDQWDILEMPGVAGKFLLNVVPKLPLLNRLFRTDYKFIFFEYIFCLPGYSGKLEILFESVLAHFNVNSGIICLDKKSEQYDMVKVNQMGITHLIQGEKEIDVVVKSSDRKIIQNDAPIHVSGYDVL